MEIYRCDFSQSYDVNYDRWPDGWKRKKDPKHPAYLKIGIDDRSAVVGDRGLRMELDGRVAAVFTPTIEVSDQFSYVLKARLKTEGLRHDVAYCSVTFYDADHNPLATHLSARGPDTARRWVTFDPLPRDKFDMDTRLRDLVHRMLNAMIHKSDVVFIPDPFDNNRGLMHAVGTPGELLLPWRTTAIMLAGHDYLGSMELRAAARIIVLYPGWSCDHDRLE